MNIIKINNNYINYFNIYTYYILSKLYKIVELSAEQVARSGRFG